MLKIGMWVAKMRAREKPNTNNKNNTMGESRMVTIPTPAFGRSNAFNLSMALVEALGHSGLTLVNMQPTPAMLEAGAKAGNIPPAAACRVYAAMLGVEV